MASGSSGSEPERLNPEQQLLAVANLKAENEALRARIAALEAAAGPLPLQPSGSAVQPNTTRVESSSSVGSTSCCSNNKNGVGEKISREFLGKAGMTAAEIARYSRHLLVPAVGVEGQRNLLDKTCLVIGAGGLASAVLPYLAGAGVGHIKIIDFDKIETSNLHRQVLYREGQAGQSKAECAAATVRDINSSIRCTAIEEALTHDNAMGTLAGVDLVVDASDNPRTRYLVNDACVLSGTPLVSGSALGMEGQVSVFHHHGGPCYRCVFPAPLAAEAGRRCSDNGVLGTVPGEVLTIRSRE
ncbi:unnamed protein product, partial [Ectocarpus sp. 4 AP-2014]